MLMWCYKGPKGVTVTHGDSSKYSPKRSHKVAWDVAI